MLELSPQISFLGWRGVWSRVEHSPWDLKWRQLGVVVVGGVETSDLVGLALEKGCAGVDVLEERRWLFSLRH